MCVVLLSLSRRNMHITVLLPSASFAIDVGRYILQHEYESAIATTARDAEQCSSATAGLAKANWHNSNLKQQVSVWLSCCSYCISVACTACANHH